MVTSVPFGISGLDDILDGGIVKNSTVLISGSPGTGKTILGLQYLYNGAKQFDDRGVYLTFEEHAHDLEEAAESLGLDEWGSLVEDKAITVHDKRHLLEMSDFSSTLDLVLDELEDESIDRLVLDSLTMFQMFFDNENERRTYLLKLADVLEIHGVTALFIHEQSGAFPRTEIGLENFLTDGNIYMTQIPTQSGVDRYIWVPKMRKKNIDTDFFPMEIGNGGITVHRDAAQFSLLGGESLSSF